MFELLEKALYSLTKAINMAAKHFLNFLVRDSDLRDDVFYETTTASTKKHNYKKHYDFKRRPKNQYLKSSGQPVKMVERRNLRHLPYQRRVF